MLQRPTMKCSLLLSIALLLTACGVEDDPLSEDQAAILGGDVVLPAGRANAEMLVRLVIGRSSACTGTLMTPDWVLTAAHCVSGVADDAVSVTAFSTGAPSNGNSDLIMVHSSYVPSTPSTHAQNDIALVHLASSINLPNHPNFRQDLYSGAINTGSQSSPNTLHCYGWGEGVRSASPPSLSELVLREATLPITGITYDGYTLGNSSSGQSIAGGDSGGPCFYEAGGRAYLTGVHSTSDISTYNGATLASYDTEISRFAFWIGQVTRRYQNLALYRPARQSSTGYGGVASRAVDGNTNGNFFSNSVTHTNLDQHAFWEVDLQQIGYVDRVQIANRTDCCLNRLSAFWVLVSDTPFSDDLDTALATPTVRAFLTWTTSPQASYSIAVLRSARYVRVQLMGQDYLSLAEVTVNGLFNIANGHAATQSSTGWGGSANRAVDGDINGDWGHGSVTHTNLDAPAWWQVDLGAGVTFVESVDIRNRTDCCSERLHHFTVYVSKDPLVRDANGAVIGDQFLRRWELVAGERTSMSLNHGGGRYLTIEMHGPDYLSLAEVLVYANRVNP